MFLINKKYKKIVSSFLVIFILTPSLFLAQPKKSEACMDSIGGPSQVISTVLDKIRMGYDQISSLVDAYMKQKETVLDGLAWVVAKNMMNSMTTEIVNWVNTGFDEGPAFVTDFERMMTDIADGVIREYVKKSELNSLCEPFQSSVKISLNNSFNGNSETGNKTYDCKVSDIVKNAGGSLKSLENDFRWGTWVEMTNKPSNNVYGAFLQAESSILEEIDIKQNTKKLQADWGGGFLSSETCEDVVDYETGETSSVCSTQTPGSVISEQLNKSLGAGQDALVTADEINEMITGLLGSLVTSVMSGSGLKDQDTSTYDSPDDLESMKEEIDSIVNDLLNIESEYNGLKNSSLDLVEEALDLVKLLVGCLTKTGESSKLVLADAFLTKNSTIPQMTIKINLSSLESTLLSELESSDALIVELNELITKATESTTVSQLTTLTEKYTSLLTRTHDSTDVSDAGIELNGYGTIIASFDNGLNYNIDKLINTFAQNINRGREGISIYPPERDKGIQQRYSECLICESALSTGIPQDDNIGDYCVVEGKEVGSGDDEGGGN